ncbi:electron transport complex subunit RsxG [Psychrosphaera aestuarii]|uniref:electron transport complex subunit RsxG n=1 Tax=Psychrosphaera aestuarii TaxID=1266052 RepID=UPI001B319E60|nr:electron transport complex subunit RsxG [Psychrosphaera aestuarii]
MTENNIALIKSKKNALLLTAFAAVCTLFVAVTHIITAPVIEEQKQQDILRKLTQVLNQDKFDNNPLENCTSINDASITGINKPSKVYRATLNDEPYALIFQTQTKQGYNGRIEVMVAINATGEVQGVRSIAHQETPGLGDKIELEKSNWVLDFNGKTVKSESDSKWFVKKDGGQFDQFTGATITPRAIVNQLRQSIFNTSQQFDDIFSLPNECVSIEVKN